jgi:membrane-bound lytic murein transglycosylase B
MERVQVTSAMLGREVCRRAWLTPLIGGCIAALVAQAASAQSAPAATAASAPHAAGAVERGHFDLTRADIQQFVDQAVASGLARDQVLSALQAAEPQPQILDAMSHPLEKTLEWWEYRARMVTPERIAAGVQLWREHKELLDQIATEYQVPPEYLVGLLGVETRYGRTTGRYRVLDALSTLAFDYPPRASYFRKELTDFLLLAQEDRLDVLSVRGSYAGAMGALQFMPSSYRHYAVSEQHETHRDLWTNWGDIFASVANYLRQAGWQSGAPVLAEAQLRSGQAPPTALVGKQHGETVTSLRTAGLTIATDLPDETPAILLAAGEAAGMGYRIGFHNFYVLTRYNTSPLYAMAVYDLSQAIRRQIAQEATF